MNVEREVMSTVGGWVLNGGTIKKRQQQHLGSCCLWHPYR